MPPVVVKTIAVRILSCLILFMTLSCVPTVKSLIKHRYLPHIWSMDFFFLHPLVMVWSVETHLRGFFCKQGFPSNLGWKFQWTLLDRQEYLAEFTAKLSGGQSVDERIHCSLHAGQHHCQGLHLQQQLYVRECNKMHVIVSIIRRFSFCFEDKAHTLAPDNKQLHSVTYSGICFMWGYLGQHYCVGYTDRILNIKKVQYMKTCCQT